MGRASADGRKKKSGPALPPARKRAPKIAVLSVSVPQPLADHAASFLGQEVANDPAFWMIALSTGIKELERQFREIEADARREAEEAGYQVIFGEVMIIDPSEPSDDDDDDLDGGGFEKLPF